MTRPRPDDDPVGYREPDQHEVHRVRGPHVYKEYAVPPSNCRPETADGRPVPTSWNPKP